ncbi:SH3 domain-containing protein [bacterium]|nr:SH3 domain-containing protein [bacterium]
MPPIRRVAPSRWMQLNLITLCLLTFGFSISDGISKARGEDPVLVDQNELTFEPYSVYIAVPKAFAHCGPADEYYRTDPLRQGQELQVYAETDDGWLGIRPPQESFCWVPAETVQKDSGALEGIIVEDRTVAWIGTHLGRARTYRWQVQLAKGEPVTVIGRSEREGPDGPQLWYRIVPPSGEYRWVHRDDIVTSSEELVALMRRDSAEETVKVFPRDRPATEPTTRIAKTASDPGRGATRDRAVERDDDIGPSVLARDGEAQQSELNESIAVGSGLNDQWRDREQGERNVQAVAFSRSRQESVAAFGNSRQPELIEIDDAPSAPDADQQLAESSWVAASSPEQSVRLNLDTPASLLTPEVGPTVGNFIARGSSSTLLGVSSSLPEASNRVPEASNRGLTLNSEYDSRPQVPVRDAFGAANPVSQAAASQYLPRAVVPASKTLTYISAERLAQIESETQQADIEQLGLIFSRLMAARATALETAPVTRAAFRLATTEQNPLVVGRARMLMERVEQYRQVAHRRDGEVVVRDAVTLNSAGRSRYPVLPASHMQSVQPVSNAGPLYQGRAQSDAGNITNATGTLVQVYSARTNSPPFALTDNSGRTIAYVTPIPGVNLRTHLNHRVSVFGNRGFLTGLSTPHIVATQAVRSQ